MPKAMRAKQLLAQCHNDIGNEEDVVVIRRGSIGTVCYATVADQYQIAKLLAEVVEAISTAARVKHDA